MIKFREEANRRNQSISYYHGDIDRNTAEKILRDYYTQSEERLKIKQKIKIK